MVSITEQADDTPTGKLLEAIIESVDEFYSENLAQEVTRGMREAASRGFWMTTYAPYGYKRVHVQDGAAKRPKLELNPPADAVVRRVFDMVLQGKSILDVTKTLNAEGIPTTNGKKWLKTTIHTMLSHEAYTGTVVWGANAKDGAPPVRVEDAHPAIVSKRDFQKARRLLGSRAPKKVNPRRASSPYLLSGIAKCETCGKAMTAAEAKSGKYTYYICHSLLKRGKGTCETPRLNAKNFEKIIVDEIRANILTESNIRDLVKLLDEEMDGVARDQRHMLESIDGELEEVKNQLGRVCHFIARSDSVDVAEACVDLVYLDPPLDSNRQYNAIYWDETGRPLPDRIEASCDRPELDEEREWAIRTLPVLMRDNGIEDATVEFWRLWMHASGNTQPQLLANLSYMMQRLLVMKRILKPTGSIYFHCDPTSSHYIKVLMDGIFGHENFQSEIT